VPPDSPSHDEVLDRYDVRELVERLVAGLEPEQIVMFGSRARGTPSRRSDLDLFIVQETDSPPLERISRAMHHLPELPYAVDVIVYRPDELARRRESPFLRKLLREGVVLYRRGEQG
jgi:predicted nucleotidyltransferase